MLEKNDLKLDRMLGPVGQLVVEKFRPTSRRDPIDIRTIGRYHAQGRLEILASQGKPSPAVLMGHPQDDERIGLGVFDQVFVRPRVNRSPAVEVDMWAQYRPQASPQGVRAALDRATRALAPNEKLSSWALSSTLEYRRRIDRPKRRGSCATSLYVLCKRLERWTLDEHSGVESTHDVAKLLERDKHAGLTKNGGLDLVKVERPSK